MKRNARHHRMQCLQIKSSDFNLPNCNNGIISTVVGSYDYYHYSCDSFDDKGWGCGYRTLQTICSWLKINTEYKKNVPSIPDIQNILVKLGDKPPSFIGSRQWIGSYEVCLVIDSLYNVPSKIIHIRKGSDLQDIVKTVQDHFANFGSPIMMGGDLDCSSKGIMGINITDSNVEFLILDPHYVGKMPSVGFLNREGWAKWQPIEDFLSSSFYNMCLPQIKPDNK